MKKRIFLATANEGKIERFKKLIESTGSNVEIYAPKDLALEYILSWESNLI